MNIELETAEYQVKASDDGLTYKVVSKVKGIRSRTFKGETAWSDANRYLWDKFANPIGV